MAPNDSAAQQASDQSADRDLLKQVALGSAAAMRDVYVRCSARAFAIGVRLLPTRADAEEVLQETFLEVWRRAREFDPARGGLETWVTTIARTRAIDRLRSLGTVSRMVEGVAQQPPPVSATPPSPDDSAAAAQDQARVRAAMAQLPPEQREVVLLGYFDGLSQSEIAKKTGQPLGTVKTRARLALEKLAVLLDAPAVRASG
ncbi:sigma-70 family RNA polymerase sigma factor [Corallococcus exiguus]|uniref:sigma-70 family RNA polymerase sigma factor n=1 Tax=Corallococcus TaxID=83461 RepID=UPI000EBCAEA4|nr:MULTISPECIES: sigma-70 family RNA polymerase sigma factor [Corallococcus]NNB86658.1 sigma-70 family RNA polymerase sigma factor [Corallococcus exiguus]NNB93492.1 sigma-70 family RNA polymerase sigma factor [Corallococcus exiguus]NNC05864.1 sigma-70 family RNA polymerase sigma factor [Corallococcus exiguus]NPC48169.1 sigma-70 family RNA polymerase sigma factor [Corallococcus exiguus]RKH78602.1 sigma-70 family RNA polymerase sigma factor [Corallococcus sp. AB032C]